MSNKKVNVRLSADFVLTPEEYKKVHGKYASLRDVLGDYVVEGELYHVNYELEDGTECNEDGKVE